MTPRDELKMPKCPRCKSERSEYQIGTSGIWHDDVEAQDVKRLFATIRRDRKFEWVGKE